MKIVHEWNVFMYIQKKEKSRKILKEVKRNISLKRIWFSVGVDEVYD